MGPGVVNIPKNTCFHDVMMFSIIVRDYGIWYILESIVISRLHSA